MSGKISGMVWDLDLPHPELLVLLAITDHANHDGRNMYPGVALLAWKTGYSARTVVRILNKLIKRGILVRERQPGRPSVFHANLDAAPRKAPRPTKTRKRKSSDIAMSYDNLSLVTSARVDKTSSSDMPSAKVIDEPSRSEPSSDRDGLTDQQKVIRALAQFHEAACGQMVAGWARKDMDALAEDFSLARIEEAIAQAEGRRIEKPFAYLRRVLLNIKALPPAAPAKPAGFWGRDFTDGE